MKLKFKKIIIRIAFTLVLCGLTALKLVRWQSVPEGFGWVIDDLLDGKDNGGFLSFTTYFGWCLSAMLALITTWLFGKAQVIFGLFSASVAGMLAFEEIAMFAMLKLGFLIGADIFSYTGLDPLISLGFIAVICVSILIMQKYEKVTI